MTEHKGERKETKEEIDLSKTQGEEKPRATSDPNPEDKKNDVPEETDYEQLSKENYDRYLRSLADFENYKKRIQKEQGDLVKFANERILKDILPILDNLDRAIAHSKETRDFKKMLKGVEMIHKQFLAILEKMGVLPIDSMDQPFDPFKHQAVGQAPIETGSDMKENQIVAETQKGYFLNERVLRPSLVIVSKQADTPPDEETESAPDSLNHTDLNKTEEV